jgi:hypothetical protein
LDFGLLLAMRAARVRFADEAVATWGQPALFVAVDLEGVASN